MRKLRYREDERFVKLSPAMVMNFEPETLFAKSEYQQPYSQHREPSLKLRRHLTGLRAPKFHTQIQDLDALR